METVSLSYAIRKQSMVVKVDWIDTRSTQVTIETAGAEDDDAQSCTVSIRLFEIHIDEPRAVPRLVA
jgi:hypothetical protein